MSQSPDPKLKRAVAPFRGRLTVEESTKIPGIYYDLNKGIFWGTLSTAILRIITSILDSALFGTKNAPPDWMKPALRPGLTNLELKILFHAGRGPLRREYVVLLLVKKLLGAMKTKVNQRLDKIRPMSGLAESGHFQAIEDAVGKGVLDDETLIEVIDKVLHDIPVQVCNPTEKILCKHTHRIVRYPSTRLHSWREEVCKHCGTVLEESAGREYERAYVTPTGNVRHLFGESKPRVHHHRARWVPGKEGKEAFCPDCKQPLSDPETYAWTAIGLEPFGDDPSRDELIVLQVEAG